MTEVTKENGKLNLYRKLLQVRKAVPYLQKGEQGHQYQYVGSSQVLGALREELDKVGLLLFPNVIDSKVTITNVENKDKFGNSKITSKLVTELKMEYTWVDVDSGEEITVPFYAQGLDTEGEKGVGKALTYAEKYFLLKQFNIATDKDDPDSFQNKVDNSSPNYISQEQVSELMSYANRVAELRGVPTDSIIQSLNMGLKSLDRLYANNYKGVREKLVGWINAAERKQGQSQPQPQQQQENVPANKNIVQDTFVLNQYEIGEHNGMPFGKIYAGTITNDELALLVKENNQLIEAIKQIPLGSYVTVNFYEENAFYFITDVVSVRNPLPQPEQQPQQPKQQLNGNNFEGFFLNEIERGTTPTGIPFTKLNVTRKSNNEQLMVFAQGDGSVEATNHLVEGQEIVMAIRRDNGFNIFVALGGAQHAS